MLGPFVVPSSPPRRWPFDNWARDRPINNQPITKTVRNPTLFIPQRKAQGAPLSATARLGRYSQTNWALHLNLPSNVQQSRTKVVAIKPRTRAHHFKVLIVMK